jgi:hypothetical protein
VRSSIWFVRAWKTKLLDRMDEDFDESLKAHLASINKDFAIARERLTHLRSASG